MLAVAAVVVPVDKVEMDPHHLVELADLVFNYHQHLEIQHQQ